MPIITSEAAQKAELGTPKPKQQTSIDHRCDERMAIVGRFPGGRPLRRRREMMLVSAGHGREGPQPSRDQ